jgi:hypothetical protein
LIGERNRGRGQHDPFCHVPLINVIKYQGGLLSGRGKHAPKWHATPHPGRRRHAGTEDTLRPMVSRLVCSQLRVQSRLAHHCEQPNVQIADHG